jgi:hypothetical protein
MELVRYRPGEAIRWLETGATNIRKDAKARGRSLVRQEEARTFGQNVRDVAETLSDFGKSAYADLMHARAKASEYVLHEDRLEVMKGGSIKSVPYSRVKAIEFRGDRAQLLLDKGTVMIKPFAYVVAGRLRVPIGWSRNGMEVPYELLIEELAARCGVEVEEG